jgi:hypothetical protein
MSAREIPSAQWPAFLEQFSRDHRAWLATVDRLGTNSPGRLEAVEQPLGSVVPQMTARRVERIEIRFQEDSRSRDAIRIDAPASIRVDETAGGVTRGLEIVDEYGKCTRIRFRAAPSAEMLDGMPPGELPPS